MKKHFYKHQVGDMFMCESSGLSAYASRGIHIIVELTTKNFTLRGEVDTIAVYKTFNLDTNEYTYVGRKVVENGMRKLA